MGLGSGVGGGGCIRPEALTGLLLTVWPTLGAAGVQGSGVGGDGDTGEGSEGVTEGHGVDALDDTDDATHVMDDVTLTGDDVDEQRDPHREPDSRRWFNMCDVNAAAVL